MLKKLQHNKKILFHLQKNIKHHAVMLTHSECLMKKNYKDNTVKVIEELKREDSNYKLVSPYLEVSERKL